MNRGSRWAMTMLGAAACAATPAFAAAQGTSTVGTLIIAHGADSVWNDQLLQLAREVHTGGPVQVALLMGPSAKFHRFQDAASELASAGARTIVVVPLLVSSHSGHYDQIRWLAGETDSLDSEMQMHLKMSGIERAHVNARLVVSPALDDAPELARILTKRALALTKTPRTQALFLVGHGPNSAEDYAAWMHNLRPVADSVKARTGFRDVKVGLVRDDAPAEVRAEAVRRIREIIALQAEVTGHPVIVVPVLLGRGGVLDKFRHDLAGLPVVYGEDPLMPDPELARWVEHRVATAAAGPALGVAR